MADTPIRVMHFVCGEYERGGMQKHVLDLASAQRAGGESVALAAHATFREKAPDGVEFLAIDTTRNRRDRSLRDDLRSLIAGWNPDIIHAHAGKAAEIGASLMPLPCASVATVHGLKRDLRAPARFDRVIAVSPFAARRLPAHKTSVVLNGMTPRCGDEPSQSSLGGFFENRSDEPIAIAIGRLAPVKGFATAIRAWRTIDHGRLVIVGDGPERDRLERMIEKFRLRDRIVMAGERADGAELIGRSDLLVAPSQREGFPYVVVEALLQRIPVVTTRTSGAAPYLPQRFIVKPGRPRPLARCVQDALSDLDTATRAFEPVFSRAARELTLEGMARATRAVYVSALKEYKERSGAKPL